MAAKGGGLSLGAIAVIVVIGLVMGKNPMEMLGLVSQMSGSGTPTANPSPAPVDDEASRFVAAILGETEDVWSALFSAMGQRYEPPRLVLFTDRVRSACGTASSAVGPFYCPVIARSTWI
jgi:predicted metalloprotease